MIDFRVARFARRVSNLCGLALAFAAALAAPHPAAAQSITNPYLDVHYEHDSNVFRAQNSQANVIAFGDPKMSDTDVKYVVGVDETYMWSQQKLTATLEGRRYDFNHYDNLNHDEYLAHVVLNWKTTSLLDGMIDARQEQIMAPFTLGNSTQLTVDVDRKINATLNLNFNPDWRLETGASVHDLKTPLQNYPDFAEHEVATHLGLINRSVANLNYGIAIDHIDGRYENAPDVGGYSQTGASLTATYIVSGLTTFNGAIGYTRRNQTQDTFSGFTGALGYIRQLTAKTSVNIQVLRAVNSYAAAGASEIDTSATVGLTWQATYKIGVAANYGYVRSTFIGQVIPGSEANGRVDTLPTESLNISYQPFKKLLLRAYLNKQSRSSNFELANFSDTVIGIDAKVSWH